jgi:hypothetical protein
MWILSNRAFNILMDGDYTLAIDLKQRDKTLTIKDLFCYQFEYNSYDGFRKLYNKVLSKIIDSIKFINDDTILGKLLKFLLRK